MSRESAVEAITAKFRAVVEGLFDRSVQWQDGQWLYEAEQAVRKEVRKIEQGLLEELLGQFRGGHVGQYHTDEQGQCRKFKEYRSRTVVTLAGPVRYRRARYESKQAQPRGIFPLDKRLGVRGAYSASVEELMAYVAAQQTYESTQQLLKKVAGIESSAETVQHVAQRWGKACWQHQQQQEKTEQLGLRMAVAVDGAMIRLSERKRKRKGTRKQHFSQRWAEAKLGVAYSFGRRGQAKSDRRYTASLQGKEKFGQKLWRLIEACGADRAKDVVWLGDGAEWVWSLKSEHLPEAVEILDFYHAQDHLWQVAHAAWGEGSKRAGDWVAGQLRHLKHSRVRKVIEELRKLARRFGAPPADCTERDRRKVVADNIRYFQNNASRMDYKRYRQRGYPIGSGVVESGCKHVVAHRLKMTASMSWNAEYAEAVLQLCCLVRSKQWNQFWQHRRAIA